MFRFNSGTNQKYKIYFKLCVATDIRRIKQKAATCVLDVT